MTDLDVVMALASAAPSFRPAWDPDDPSPYVDVGDLVYYLESELLAGRTVEVTAVFGVAERLLLDHPEVRTFIQVGLFESVQNTSGRSGLDQEAFEPFLLPRSRVLWDDLNRLWGGSTTRDG